MIRVYRLLTAILAVPALAFVNAVAIFSRRWRLGLARRLGFVGPRRDRKRMLLELASVGEVISGEALARAISERIGADRLVISVMTPTGYQEAIKRFPDHEVAFFPADAAWIPDAWLRRMNIARVILFETEMWPLFLDACSVARVPVAVVNARISDKSYPMYRLVKRFMRHRTRHNLGGKFPGCNTETSEPHGLHVRFTFKINNLRLDLWLAGPAGNATGASSTPP